MTTPLVSLTDVVVHRGDFQFGPATFRLDPGYVLGVVGPNGSGKSTLFSTMMNLVHPDMGEVRLFGRTYAEDPDAIRERVAFVPETSIGLDRLSAGEIAAYAARWYPRWDATRFADLMRDMEVDPAQRFATSSKGMRRRLSSAIALATGADLLLADEPMDAIDPFLSEYLLDRYTDFMGEGERGIIFSTHALDDVRRIADGVLLVNEGHLVGMYDKDDLLSSWGAVWLDDAPRPGTPGVVTVAEGPIWRILTNDTAATIASVRAEGRTVIRTAAPDLAEVLGALLEEDSRRSVPAM